MNINRIFHNKIHRKRKTIFIILVLFFIVCMSSFYGINQYSKLINDFKTNFNEYKFSEANNILLTKQNLNPFKIFIFKNDISKYFNTKIINISNDIKDNRISAEDALIQLKEIDHYKFINSAELYKISNSLNLIQESAKNFNTAVNYFNDEKYIESISYFKKISALDLNYPESLIYLNNSKNKIKKDLFTYCDNLVNNNYYTEALSKLSDNNDILGNDLDIKEKISDIKSKQQEYLDKNSAIVEASSKALTTYISTKNINTLNIESSTSYFINVNLEEQKTYIYKGKVDKWKLIKVCSCSTGINGENTPSGSFSIKEKGDWFFSDKYQQGGKYWTQITGDILFHSIPFSKNKTTILDYTMNKPSSHGCVRLSIDDAKWIYNNIPKGSKVIIK